MATNSIFKAGDIRGVYGKDIDEGVISRIGKGAAHFFESGVIIIAHDVRLSSPSLTEALSEGLENESRKIGKQFDIKIVGYSTTPMFYFLVNHFGANGGLMVTASHNPKEYNGVKIVEKGAVPISGIELEPFFNAIL